MSDLRTLAMDIWQGRPLVQRSSHWPVVDAAVDRAMEVK